MVSRLLRKRLLAIAVAGVGAIGLMASPAGAASTTAGAFYAPIHLTPGLPTGNVCATEAFFFYFSPGAGAVTAGSQAAAGEFATSVITGGSATYPLPLPPPIGCGPTASENLLAGAGVINPFTFSPYVPVVGYGSGGACAGGSYLRLGYILLLDLTGCSTTVSGPLSGGGGGQSATFGPPTDIRIVTSFLPSVPQGSNGVTTPVEWALLYGVWAGATAS